ncbi:MAG: cytochrome C oxidase subunit I, partial [Chitinophagaceae bacterium]
MFTTTHNATAKTTSHKVVLPFYLYAAIAYGVVTVLLFFSTSAFTEHYFHPFTLAITHTMALGWGTMIIL